MESNTRQFVLRIEPRTKKNSMEIRRKGNGERFISPSSAYKAWEKTAAEILAILNRGHAPITEPVNVEEIFYVATARRVDLTNLQEAADDALVRGGVLADDNTKILAGHEGSRVLIDRRNPRILIRITPAEPWQIFREVKQG